jgi:O-antigen ligase
LGRLAYSLVQSAGLAAAALAVPGAILLWMPMGTQANALIAVPLAALGAAAALLGCAAWMGHPLWNEARGAAARVPLLRRLGA